MKWINVSYAGYFNRKYQRNGHLFQGRFKSILVDADEYLKQLSRYIHLNPVRANIVERPAEYQWSSYPVFIGKASQHEWLEVDWLLSQFGRKRNDAIKNYIDFVEKVDANELENPAKELSGGFILGNPDFVTWVKKTFLSNRSDESEIPQLRQLKPRINLDRIVSAVCEEFDCDTELILRRGHKKNMARDVAIYLARALTGETGKKLGEYFGDVSGAVITLRYNFLAKQVVENKKLKTRTNKLINRTIWLSKKPKLP